jgi:hypothetical protein
VVAVWASASTSFLFVGSALYGCSTRVRCGVQPSACVPRLGRDGWSVTLFLGCPRVAGVRLPA